MVNYQMMMKMVLGFFVMVVFQHLIQLTLMLKITYKHLRHQFHHIKSPPAVPETPEIPVDRAVTVNCPTEAQKLKEPIGTLLEGGTKKIVEYRLVGKECIPVKEDIKIPDQIIQAIPSAGNSITTTASIAVVATTSALLAKNLLLIFC